MKKTICLDAEEQELEDNLENFKGNKMRSPVLFLSVILVQLKGKGS